MTSLTLVMREGDPEHESGRASLLVLGLPQATSRARIAAGSLQTLHQP